MNFEEANIVFGSTESNKAFVSEITNDMVSHVSNVATRDGFVPENLIIVHNDDTKTVLKSQLKDLFKESGLTFRKIRHHAGIRVFVLPKLAKRISKNLKLPIGEPKTEEVKE